MVDYMGAIKKPFQDIQTLIIGVIIGFIPFVSLIVSGYGIGVARKTIKGDNSLPKWGAGMLVEYIKDFIMGLIIGFVYTIPAGVVFIIGALVAGGSLLAAFSSLDPSTFATSLVGALVAGGVFFLVALLLAFIGFLFAIMGLQYYAKEGSLGAAFQFGKILKKILTGTFWITLIVWVIYSIVLFIVFLVLSIVPVIGSFIGIGLLTFAGTVTANSMMAQVFKETPM